MSDEILTPRCPLCDEPPIMVFGGGTQAFCGTEGCPGFTWDMTKPLDELLMNASAAKITVGAGEEVAEHRSSIRPGINPDGLYSRAVSVEDPKRVVAEHPITDFNAATSGSAANDQVEAWLAEHPTDEVHVYIYDGDSGQCIQTIIVRGDEAA